MSPSASESREPPGRPVPKPKRGIWRPFRRNSLGTCLVSSHIDGYINSLPMPFHPIKTNISTQKKLYKLQQGFRNHIKPKSKTWESPQWPLPDGSYNFKIIGTEFRAMKRSVPGARFKGDTSKVSIIKVGSFDMVALVARSPPTCLRLWHLFVWIACINQAISEVQWPVTRRCLEAAKV